MKSLAKTSSSNPKLITEVGAGSPTSLTGLG